jgi:hypothetical protein
MKEKTIILDGFSKTYAMTGWRLGYGVMRKDFAPKITQLMINCNSCTSTFTQMAGVEALRGPQSEAEKMVAEFKKRREVIVSGLNGIKGMSCKKPHGAFYVFPNIKKTGKTSNPVSTHLRLCSIWIIEDHPEFTNLTWCYQNQSIGTHSKMSVAYFFCQVTQIHSRQILHVFCVLRFKTIDIDIIVAQSLHLGEFNLHVCSEIKMQTATRAVPTTAKIKSRVKLKLDTLIFLKPFIYQFL